VSTRIKYDAKTPHGQLLAESVDRLIEATERVIRVRRAIEAMSADTGSGTTFDQVETELGMLPGSGAALLTLLLDAEQKLTNANVYAFRDKLDQG